MASQPCCGSNGTTSHSCAAGWPRRDFGRPTSSGWCRSSARAGSRLWRQLLGCQSARATPHRRRWGANPQEPEGVAVAKPYPHDFSFLEVIRAFAIILIPAAVLAKLVGFLPPIEVPSKAPSLTQDDLRHQWVPWAQLYGSAELGVAIAEAERREDQPGHTRGFEDLLSNDLARAITPTL